MFDVVSLGEAMLRLVPPNYERIEQANSFKVTIGGAELNVVADLSRLGIRTAWISKLPLNPMGRMIANKAREQGVDTSHIIWSNAGRAGLYFVEFGSTPRATSVIYDRGNSTASMLMPGEVKWDEVFEDSKVFHTSGITPALSRGCREVTMEAFESARRAGCKTSFDLNYRAKLWPPAEAKECYERLLDKVDILITTQFDAEEVLGYTGTYGEIAKQLSDDFGIPIIAITLRRVISVLRGTWTSLVYADGKFYTDDETEIEIVDRFGAGDAFSAGFIYGYLRNGVEQGQKIGNAMASLKHSVPGDMNWITMEDIEKYLKSKDFRVQR
jgi:2-dehydro-3-deoxygluconokinase